MNELTCKELVELVTTYLDDALSPIDKQRFETHLAGCTGCQNYLKQMQRTIQLIGTLTEESLPTETKTTLLQAFRDWKQDQSKL